MIDIESAIAQKFPSILKYPGANALIWFFKKLIHQNEMNEFIENNKNQDALGFSNAVIDYFNFCYKVSPQEKERIPSSGRVLIVANHPLGALDALSLYSMVKTVRKDVKVIASDMLLSFAPLRPALLKLDITTQSGFKKDLKAAIDALNNEEAVIIFPSGEVSRMSPVGIRDNVWMSGAAFLAEKGQTPILPVHIKAKNSWKFYFVSMINKPISIALLPHEMFLQKNKSLSFTIGDIIGVDAFAKLRLSRELKSKLLRKHVYRVAKAKKPIFETQKSVAHAQDSKLVRDEIKSGTLLGNTTDGKSIYLCEYKTKSPLMLEIGRLREYTFRKVGEGTGESLDLDKYDEYYKHLVLWDDKELEIVGSYRLGIGSEILQKYGVSGFYSSTLFGYTKNMENYMQNALEMGRSFVQPKYWGTKALDYLWQGIGAYLAKNPAVKYMFGPVSLSATYADSAKKLIIYFYLKYFGYEEDVLATAKREYALNAQDKDNLEKIFIGGSYEADFAILKQTLKNYNSVVPVLYKQYAELCDDKGTKFLAFNIDQNFSNCVDGLILVDIAKITQAKRERYIG